MTAAPHDDAGAPRRARWDVLGIAAALGAATIWGGALAFTRFGLAAPDASLGAHDMVLLRFLGPAALLLPLAWRGLRRLGVRDAPAVLVLLAGGGAPFVLVVAGGLRLADAADAGALLPGTLPLWVALSNRLAGLRATPAPAQRLGLALIAMSTLIVAGPALLDGDAWEGPALLLAGGWLAAGYTLALRRIRLSPLEATALVSLGSVVGFAPLYFLAMQPGLGEAPWACLAQQAVWQGGISGLAGPLVFAVAVARLGAARASAFGALSPLAAALFGAALLGELPERHAMFGLVAAGIGVALSARGR